MLRAATRKCLGGLRRLERQFGQKIHNLDIFENLNKCAIGRRSFQNVFSSNNQPRLLIRFRVIQQAEN